LTELIIRLNGFTEHELIPNDIKLLGLFADSGDPYQEVNNVLNVIATTNSIIQDIHSCIAKMKIQFT